MSLFSQSDRSDAAHWLVRHGVGLVIKAAELLAGEITYPMAGLDAAIMDLDDEAFSELRTAAGDVADRFRDWEFADWEAHAEAQADR